jgi:PHD/YefM family antitoxin component YafN of YafNO toxin-antitoxin module
VKTPLVQAEQYLIDAKGKRTAVVLDLRTYEYLREAEEELADIQAYDSSVTRVHAEVASGRSSTLEAYRVGRKRKSK